MEIKKWNKSGGGQMVRVNRKEALQIITSLSQQLLSGDCNTERAEFTDTDGRYFSIAVHEKPTPEEVDQHLCQLPRP